MRRCIVCGCTEDVACELGCSWSKIYSAKRGLCSECPEPVHGRKLTQAQIDKRVELQQRVTASDRQRRLQLRGLRIAQDTYDSLVAKLRAFEVDAGGEYQS